MLLVWTPDHTATKGGTETDRQQGKIQRRGRQRESQKNNRFYKQNNNFAHDITLFCIFLCPFLHDYDVKVPNFAFCGSHKQGPTKSISLFELGYGP